MDAEAELIAWLNENSRAPAYAEVPPEGSRPAEFLTVERTGGPRGVGVDRPMMAVQCWAKTRAEAAALAEETASLMPSFAREGRVSSVSQNSLHSHPTAKGEPRYQIVFDMTVLAES